MYVIHPFGTKFWLNTWKLEHQMLFSERKTTEIISYEMQNKLQKNGRMKCFINAHFWPYCLVSFWNNGVKIYAKKLANHINANSLSQRINTLDIGVSSKSASNCVPYNIIWENLFLYQLHYHLFSLDIFSVLIRWNLPVSYLYSVKMMLLPRALI